MTQILVVGGAGYIGSHMVKLLLQQGYAVVVLDKNPQHPPLTATTWVTGDLGDQDLVRSLFQKYEFAAVMHFAAYIEVGESVNKPEKYYHNNFVNTFNLLACMRERGINKFIFSSTAAIFGEPQYTPIDEKHPIQPINPYGRSKAMVEGLLQDYDRAYGLKSMCFRYFNAAGADPDGELGECHEPESHLLPLILQVASKRREKIFIYGDDYATKDGSCIRDYIHVADLCQAHLLGLQKLINGADSQNYNLGNGTGFSVKEVIDTAEKISGQTIAREIAPRRTGDPAVLIADSQAAFSTLGWQPQFQSLETIVKHAWHWEQKLAQGFRYV